MVTYNIILSQSFPSWHLRHGEPTCFVEQLQMTKLHTIRANSTLWQQRFKKILAGDAELCIRVWLGKPYRSKTKEIIRLGKDSGIGIQELRFEKDLYDLYSLQCPVVDGHSVRPEVLASHDGLSYEDWQHWFQNYDISQSMAVIHFTSFRY
jgi:hypothetical protein